METMGPAGIQRTEKTRSKQISCLEYLQVGAWAVAIEPQSGIGVCTSGKILCQSGTAEAACETDIVSGPPWSRAAGRPVVWEERGREASPYPD